MTLGDLGSSSELKAEVWIFLPSFSFLFEISSLFKAGGNHGERHILSASRACQVAQYLESNFSQID